MKKIGIIDYYISEWHANKYYSLLDKASRDIGEEFKIAYAYGELDVSLYDGLTTAQWCEKYGVTPCATIDELCELSDYIMILAPSNPERHLDFARAALKHGKSTFIDKTFAPDLATAKEIYAIAEQYGTKIFSTSALRYASEVCALEGVKNLITTGGGSNFDEYVIHQAEMAVKLLGCEFEDISVRKCGNQRICSASFKGGKNLTMIYASALSYSVCAELEDGTTVNCPITSSFFDSLIADVLRFYLEGTPSFPKEQTIAVADLRERAIKA